MSWFTVTDPKAAKLLLDGNSRYLFEPFLLGSHSVKDLADSLGLSLEVVYHQIKRFERHGLLKVERLETRRGRATKYYRASADGFFVPFYVTPYNTLEGFVQHIQMQAQTQFNHLVAQVGHGLIQDPSKAGFRVYRVDNYVNTELTPNAEQLDILTELLAPDAPALMISQFPLKLSRAEAKALQREMLELLMRYTNKGGEESYLVQVGLVPGEYSWR